MAEFNFAALSPDVILDAIESVGIEVASGLLPLNSYENRVYQFIASDNKRYVVKFYRPQRWTKQQLIEEHEFAHELANHDIPVVAPLNFSAGSLLEYQSYYFALYPSVGGRQFEVDNLEQLEWMGRFIGRIHQVAQGKDFEFRPKITLDAYLNEPGDVLRNSQIIPVNLHEAFFTIVDMVINQVREQFSEHHCIRLHGDCHPGNILWRDGPSFVDLDDCRMGPAIQDLWMMLSGDRQEQLLQLDTLVEAYSEYCDFDHSQLTLIEPLRAMRMIHYMGWLANRWHDPAFPAAFPWFATQQYWEQQILALKEQFAALQEPPLTLMSQINGNC
ncbi:serine/threonine protein kinase [Neptunicella marina]|uniref:Stress response kinase A n=1 Tax=Neptunicella marina TaxID=2125989 RepID=A0A8J6IU98_9ALTE|nr:serine/threonine protein kinase [Neptunicella marina]